MVSLWRGERTNVGNGWSTGRRGRGLQREVLQELDEEHRDDEQSLETTQRRGVVREH